MRADPTNFLDVSLNIAYFAKSGLLWNDEFFRKDFLKTYFGGADAQYYQEREGRGVRLKNFLNISDQSPADAASGKTAVINIFRKFERDNSLTADGALFLLKKGNTASYRGIFAGLPCDLIEAKNFELAEGVLGRIYEDPKTEPNGNAIFGCQFGGKSRFISLQIHTFADGTLEDFNFNIPAGHQ